MPAPDDVKAVDLKYLRSPPSRIESLARFYNSTSHRALLVWINQEGHGCKMAVLNPREFVDINTYGGHKWVFMRCDTMERLCADGRTVWIGEPKSHHPGSKKGTFMRLVVRITVPVYTLREICLKTVSDTFSESQHLSLPESLQEDLKPGASFFKDLMPFVTIDQRGARRREQV